MRQWASRERQCEVPDKADGERDAAVLWRRWVVREIIIFGNELLLPLSLATTISLAKMSPVAETMRLESRDIAVNEREVRVSKLCELLKALILDSGRRSGSGVRIGRVP